MAQQTQTQIGDPYKVTAGVDVTIAADWTIAVPTGQTIVAATQRAWDFGSMVEQLQLETDPAELKGLVTQHLLRGTRMRAGHTYLYRIAVRCSDGEYVWGALLVLAQ